MADGCVFCEIIDGRRDSFGVFADEHAVGFLDRRPLFPGHVLVVPREHHETLTDLPVTQVGPLFERARTVASLMEDELGAAGSFVAMNNRVSQSVPHLHVHVVPRRSKDGLRGFFWPRNPYDDDAHAAQVAERLAAAYTAIVNG